MNPMNTPDMNLWQRLEFDATPIYLQPETPLWIVPTQAGDTFLQMLRNNEAVRNGFDQLGMTRARQMVGQMTIPAPDPYPGRSALLPVNRLEECWFHITDLCNLACRHCLFTCSPHSRTTLSLEQFRKAFVQSFNLGARLFFLTGGEPLMHPSFSDICRIVLSHSEQNHLVVLTNGLLLEQRWPSIAELPLERLHLQISVDGDRSVHDRIRGKGSYDRLVRALSRIGASGIDANLAMAVERDNLAAMEHPVELAASHGIGGVHYLWLLVAGKAQPESFVETGALFDALVSAQLRARKAGIDIDNISALAGRVFSPPGTRHDLGGGGWTSIAVGPNGDIYPTPALVGQARACAGHIRQGIDTVWRESVLFRDLRALSVVSDPEEATDPLRFITGGSDMDHSYYATGRFSGGDPYRPLYRRLALWLMAGFDTPVVDETLPQLRFKMGDRLLSCDNGGNGVSLTHSNCVLSVTKAREVVGAFYADAAVTPNADIINPVCYDEREIAHIPESARVRSYGCGSPVMDADLEPGETLVDLGSGAGVECFIAAQKVGSSGLVVGIDMTDDMLALANGAVDAVADNLGYSNVTFRKGYLEALPLGDGTADAVISNCVVNLSEDKQRTFSEIYRILKPGGRLLISDVTTDSLPPAAILNDAKLRGECISGAMLQTRLVSLLETIGFERIQLLKRFFYREVQGHRFHSLTFAAYRPGGTSTRTVIYPGPFAAVVTDSGRVLLRGQTAEIPWVETDGAESPLFLLDESGGVLGNRGENTCACCTPPEDFPAPDQQKPAEAPPAKLSTGCMRCGGPLEYMTRDRSMACCFCGEMSPANAVCTNGHFVCDRCHSQDADAVVRHICLTTGETDMITLINTVRSHPAVPLHGPEHHFAIAGVIVATYRNLGGEVTDADILTAIDRGKGIPGGTCGFWGGCGAPLGAGIAFGVMLKSTPVTPTERRVVQSLTGTLISDISGIEAARCCQREIWSVLKKIAALSRQILPIPLKAEGDTRCRQMHLNKECPGKACPWFGGPRKDGSIK
jgi:MoaA/NifB/PqqE/SkfB family radical SAM enzyme/SAM-dependent methyltransferase